MARRAAALWKAFSGAELVRRGLPRAAMMRLDPAIILSALLINLMALAMPLAVLQIYDRIAPTGAYATLWALTAGLLAVALIEFGLRVAQGTLANIAAARWSHAVHVLALRRILGDGRDAGERPPAATVLDQLRSIDRVAAFYGGHPRLALIDMPFSLIFIGMIAIIAGPLALVPIAVVAIFIHHVATLSRLNRDVAEARDTQDRRAGDFMSEVLSGSYTVKSFAIEIIMLRRFERLLKRSAGLQRQAVLLSGDLQRASAIFGNASVLSMVAIGALAVIWGDLSIGGLAACSLLSGRAAQPLLKAASAWNELERLTLAIDQAAALFEDGPAPRATPAAAAAPGVGATPAAAGSGSEARAARISARGLRLARNGRTLIEDAWFEIDGGAIVELRGAAGSGRSSLMAAAAGLLAPSAGALLVDGAPAVDRRADPGFRISSYSPLIRPFNGTLLQNLTLFGRGATVEQARGAVRLLGLESAVDLLPQGYDTPLGAGVAETLPSGLLRRLLLARAIAQQPRLLLLDAPEAYLDESSVRRTAEALATLRGHATVLMTSDSPTLCALADLALSFENAAVSVAPPRAADAREDRFSDGCSDGFSGSDSADAEGDAPQKGVA